MITAAFSHIQSAPYIDANRLFDTASATTFVSAYCTKRERRTDHWMGELRIWFMQRERKNSKRIEESTTLRGSPLRNEPAESLHVLSFTSFFPGQTPAERCMYGKHVAHTRSHISNALPSRRALNTCPEVILYSGISLSLSFCPPLWQTRDASARVLYRHRASCSLVKRHYRGTPVGFASISRFQVRLMDGCVCVCVCVLVSMCVRECVCIYMVGACANLYWEEIGRRAVYPTEACTVFRLVSL